MYFASKQQILQFCGCSGFSRIHTVGDVPYPGARTSAVIKGHGKDGSKANHFSEPVCALGLPVNPDPVQFCSEKSQPEDLAVTVQRHCSLNPRAPQRSSRGERGAHLEMGLLRSCVYAQSDISMGILNVQLMSWLWCPALPGLSFVKGVRARFQLPKLQ